MSRQSARHTNHDHIDPIAPIYGADLCPRVRRHNSTQPRSYQPYAATVVALTACFDNQSNCL